MGCTQAYKSRNHITTISIRNSFSKSFGFRRITNQTKLVTQPLNSSTSYEDRTFQGIFHLTVHAPSNSSNKTVLRRNRFFASVHQHKTASAVSVLRFTGSKASLSEESALLVACSTCDGYFFAKNASFCMTVKVTGRFNFR